MRGSRCAPCTSSPGLVEGSFLTSSSDTTRSLPLSGTPTVAPCSESEPPTDGSPTCTCGKGTSGCSIHPKTRDEWIASMRASLVKISALLALREGSAKEREADFTGKCSELLASFDRATSSWKTAQPSLLTRSLEPFSGTWPRSGMMRGGRVYRHRQPVPRTAVIAGGALQREANQKLWPTPTACASKGSTPGALRRKNGRSREMDRLDHAVRFVNGGPLSPWWVEWLLGGQ